jgi:hypothetical protein
MAVVRNYTIERGIAFTRQVTLKAAGTPLDLTGATVAGDVRLSELPTDIRAFPTGTGGLITSLDCAIADDPTSGVFTFGLSLNKTILLVRGVYDYDIIVTFPPSDKRRVIMGQLTSVEITTHAD